MATSTASKMKPRKLGIAPTLVVMVLVFGLAMLIGVILLMMYVRTGIEHSPEQSKLVVPGQAMSFVVSPLRAVQEHVRRDA